MSYEASSVSAGRRRRRRRRRWNAADRSICSSAMREREFLSDIIGRPTDGVSGRGREEGEPAPLRWKKLVNVLQVVQPRII